MEKFIYTGETPCHTTTKVGEEVKQISLHKGETITLPKDNEFARRMVAQNLLTKFINQKDK